MAKLTGRDLRDANLAIKRIEEWRSAAEYQRRDQDLESAKDSLRQAIRSGRARLELLILIPFMLVQICGLLYLCWIFNLSTDTFAVWITLLSGATTAAAAKPLRPRLYAHFKEPYRKYLNISPNH